MKKLKSFKMFLESNWNPDSLSETDPIDFILDIYNKYGYQGMLEPEIEFMKSGGTEGHNFRYNLRTDLQESLAQAIKLLKSRSIEYTIVPTMSGDLGWFWFIKIKYDKELSTKYPNLFVELQSIYPDPEKDPEQKRLFPYVYMSKDDIIIYLVDLDWYGEINKIPIIK